MVIFSSRVSVYHFNVFDDILFEKGETKECLHNLHNNDQDARDKWKIDGSRPGLFARFWVMDCSKLASIQKSKQKLSRFRLSITRKSFWSSGLHLLVVINQIVPDTQQLFRKLLFLKYQPTNQNSVIAMTCSDNVFKTGNHLLVIVLLLPPAMPLPGAFPIEIASLNLIGVSILQWTRARSRYYFFERRGKRYLSQFFKDHLLQNQHDVHCTLRPYRLPCRWNDQRVRARQDPTIQCRHS